MAAGGASRSEVSQSDVTTAWERHAGWWQAHHTSGEDPEYEDQIIPLIVEQCGNARRILDLGCGEGQVARALVAALSNREVVGLDIAHAQLVTAATRGGGLLLLRGDLTTLPFRSGSFDGAVACLVFDHVVDFERTLDEVARVLTPGGIFVFLVNHPLMQTPDSGWIDDQILGEHYWRVGPYAVDRVWSEEIAPGVDFPFVHRPISRYINAMASRGLLVEEMLEPLPTPGFVAMAAEYEELVGIPRLLIMRLRRQP